MLPGLRTAAFLVCMLGGTSACWPQVDSTLTDSYPSRPIRLVVPVPPGAAQDILAREVGRKLSEAFGRPVVIDNRAGGNGMVGMEIAARSPGNGHTILLTSNALSVLPSLYPRMSFDVFRDLAPVCLVAIVPNILVVNPSVPAKSVKELIALARARPGELNFAAATAGGSVRLAGELFKIMARVDIVMVPYKGGGLALIDLIGGQVQMGFPDVLAAVPHVRAGRLRALGVTTGRRLASLPDVPAIAEAGVPGYEMAGWYGILAPTTTPKRIRSMLNAQIVKLLRAPEMLDKLSAQEAIVAASTEDEFAAYLKAEYVKWAKVIREAGIKAEQ
jgi:tripartite-type tricarboxylate transporter receptor subunit TctC